MRVAKIPSRVDREGSEVIPRDYADDYFVWIRGRYGVRNAAHATIPRQASSVVSDQWRDDFWEDCATFKENVLRVRVRHVHICRGPISRLQIVLANAVSTKESCGRGRKTGVVAVGACPRSLARVVS